MKYTAPEKPFVYQNLINGQWTDSDSAQTFDRMGPGLGKVVGIYPKSTKKDTEQAISAAKSTFIKSDWPSLPGSEREVLIRNVANLIRKNKEDLALIETLESGKPISQSLDEMDWTANLWDYAATLCRHQYGDTNMNLGSDMLAFMYRQPIGVVGMITPWNFPLLIISQKLPFALATGCTAVVKPSEATPGTTLKLGQLCLEAGIPKGVVNVVTGFGDPVGIALSESTDVDMISFTGSTTVGKQIVKASRHNLKKLSLELGGKNPQIIFNDANLDQVVDAVVFGVYFNMGECCNSGSRIIVEESIVEELTDRIVAHSKKVKVGNPLDPSVKVGAIINEDQKNKIKVYIERGKEEGAELLLGGHVDETDYIQPTIFSKVHKDMTIAKEEIFGPVLSILTFKNLDEAIDIANSTLFGLSASIWTQHLDTALIMSRKIDAGTIWVNNFMTGFPEVPFGGFKESGIGRELGRFSLQEFSELKSVIIRTGSNNTPWID